MVTIVRDRIQDMVRRRLTLEQVKAARPTKDYDALYSTPAYTGDMFVEAAYRSLSTATAQPQKGATR
jgi:cyclase